MVSLLSKRLKADPLHIWLQSDVHIGNEEFHEKEYVMYKDWYHNTEGAYTMWLGDIFEWSIPVHLPQAMKMQDIRTQDQWLLFKQKLKEEKPLVFLAGNHEFRIIRYGFHSDPFMDECKKLRVPYSRTACFFNLRTPRGWYVWYLAHGYGNSYYPDSAHKSLYRKGVTSRADIVALGHTHHNWVGGKLHYDITTKELKTKYQNWIRTGSFLTNPEYAAQRELRPELIGNVIASFDTSKSQVIFSQTLDQWRNHYE